MATRWNQPRCPSPREWNKKVQCIYILEYYRAIKKNEIMSFAGKWTELGVYFACAVNMES
jgi:hypothetical protein